MGEFIENITREGKPDPPKRPQHPESWVNGPKKCGDRRDHLVRVHRSHWPPRPMPGLNGPPYLAANCERCGAVCIVTDPVPADLTVVLYGKPEEAAGRVVEEETTAGTAIDESALPDNAGHLVDEAAPKRATRAGHR